MSARKPKTPIIIYGLFNKSLKISSQFNCWSKTKYVTKCNNTYQNANKPILRLNFIKFRSNNFLIEENNKTNIKNIRAYSPSSCSSAFNGSGPSKLKIALQNKMTAGRNPNK